MALIREWRKGKTLPRSLFLRVAVREIEAWLLADREGMARYLKIERRKITGSPEELADPKRYLLDLARWAPRELRAELLPVHGSVASQGFGYNSCMRKFVAEVWSPSRAAESSESLRRAINRISELPRMVQGANA